MIFGAVLLAFLIRKIPRPRLSNDFFNSWYYTLLLFILPPLFLLMTVLAILFMGFRGRMLGLQIIWLGNLLAILFLSLVIISAVKLIYQSRLTQKKINSYPRKLILGRIAIILPINLPYCAQVGVLKPQLIISQGLINVLDCEHLEAVLLHEEAHNYYQDSFWFFCLGWLKDFSFWLPHTELLWQDLLLLREIRADRKAAQETSPLIIAESLLTVAQNFISSPFNFSIPFSIATPINRLTTRIDALFIEKPETNNYGYYYWSCLLLIFVPWIAIFIHN